MLMCPRASSSAGKLQGGYRMQTLLMMRNMVWRISNWSFRTIKLRFSSCCCGITTGKTVLFFPIFSSSLILYILLPWQLNIFCPSVWWQSRYIHLFMNLVFKRQIIFSQLLYVFKPLFGMKRNIAASWKQWSINHTAQAVHCPGDTPASLIATTNEKVEQRLVTRTRKHYPEHTSPTLAAFAYHH